MIECGIVSNDLTQEAANYTITENQIGADMKFLMSRIAVKAAEKLGYGGIDLDKTIAKNTGMEPGDAHKIHATKFGVEKSPERLLKECIWALMELYLERPPPSVLPETKGRS